MQLQHLPVQLSMIRTAASPMFCPLCDQMMLAPVSSQFVKDGEICHLWECETCGETTLATIDLVDI